jgi:hypothetical protein
MIEFRELHPYLCQWPLPGAGPDPSPEARSSQQPPNVRRAGRAGYRGLQAFALIFVFALMLLVVIAPFAVIYGNQAPSALGPALLVLAIFLTWRLYRWFYRGDKKNST